MAAIITRIQEHLYRVREQLAEVKEKLEEKTAIVNNLEESLINGQIPHISSPSCSLMRAEERLCR